MRITKHKKILLLITFLLFFSTTVLAQDDDTATREITSLDFQKQRPKASGKKKPTPRKRTPKQETNAAVIANKNRKYSLVKRVPKKAATGGKTTKAEQNSEQIGVTFWRLRPIYEDDDNVPIFPVRMGDRTENWTAERVNSTTKFKKGDRVRFTIESSRSGFLYIVNREFYTDGTTGAANIIFPTLRTRSGDNRVSAGSLIDVPASTDSVPYFTIKPKREDYAGEELVVLITKEELPLNIGMKPIAINAPQIEKWADDWASSVDIYDAEDGEGIAMTGTELAAAQTSSRALEQEEPLPQTIYKVRIGGDVPLFVAFRMISER